MSMGLDVDRRIGPLLLHSYPFKPEGVTVSMSDTGGQKKVLDCSNVISDEPGLLSCVFVAVWKGPCVCISTVLFAEAAVSHQTSSLQTASVSAYWLSYFLSKGDVKYYPCTIHSSVSMCLFVVAMVSACVSSSFTQWQSVLTNCIINQVEHSWGQEDICTTICTGTTLASSWNQ